MFEKRNVKLDLFALALLALVVFLASSLVTYDPADPVAPLVSPLNQLYSPDVLIYPQHEELSNACGRWGAVVSDGLLTGLGLGAYYLVVTLALLDVSLLRRQIIDAPAVRTLGWLVSMIGLSTVLTMLCPGMSPGPVIGSGGYLGALANAALQSHFAMGGALIFATSLIIGGLLLTTDYALLDLAQRGGAAAWRGARSIRPGRATDVANGKLSSSEETASSEETESEGTEIEESDDEYEEGEAEDDELAVRIRGRRVNSESDEQAGEEDAEEDEDAEAQYEDEEGDEADEESDDEEVGELEEDEEESQEDTLRVRRPRDKSERELVMHQLNEASLTDEATDYELPGIDLLIEADDVSFDAQAKEVRRKAKILEKTFSNFGFRVKVVEIETGPVIAQYEVELEAGLRLSRITGLADDLAIALRVPSVRIVAPIPGKNTVGIEVPNETRQLVRLREVIEEMNGRAKKMRIPLFLGKDVSGNPLAVDLATLPHLLIAGRTGTGKSVCLNAIISSILMTRRPDEVRMLMIDPKMVELSGYGRLPHLMHPVVTDMRKAEAILAWAVEKMEERYSLLARAGVRHISIYNQLGEEELMERLQPENDEERENIPQHLPFIVIVADEIADLMMTSGKEVEQHIIRLAQKSRAVGIHLILATQKPTVDVITGLIKSNLPARIAFQVASRTDSRVVLDEMGADKLLGNGDMLFLWPGTSTLLRGQGTYLGDDEINNVVDAVSTGEQNFVNELVNMKVEESTEAEPGVLKKRDELYESAVDVVVREGRGSVSLLQRSLGIGYGRAARLIDFMAEDGIVGTYAGSQAREVLMSVDDLERMQGGEPAASQTAPPPPPKSTPARRNRIVPDSSWEEDGEENAASPVPDTPRKSRKLKLKKEDLDEPLDEEDKSDENGVTQLDEFCQPEELEEADDENEEAAAEYDEEEYEQEDEEEEEEEEYEDEAYDNSQWDDEDPETDAEADAEVDGEVDGEEEDEECEEDEYEEPEYEEEEYEEAEYEEAEYEEEEYDAEEDEDAEELEEDEYPDGRYEAESA